MNRKIVHLCLALFFAGIMAQGQNSQANGVLLSTEERRAALRARQPTLERRAMPRQP